MKVTDDNNISISASSGESYVVVLSGSKYAEVTVPSGAAKTVSTATSSSVSVSVLPSSSTSVSIAPVSRSIDVFGKGAKGDKGEKGEPGISGSGSSFLTENLTVTNPVGEAESRKVYSQLTEIEDIVRDMLTINLEPSPQITSASFGEEVLGEFIEYQDHEYKFEIGDPLLFNSVTITSSDMELMNPNSVMSIQYMSPSGDESFQVANPLIQPPENGWTNYPSTSTVNVNEGGLSTSINLNYSTLGKKTLKTVYVWNDGGADQAEASSKSFDFYIGKKIRCFTSVSADPKASNLSSLLSDAANVFDPENSVLLTGVLLVDANEDQYVDVMTDFVSEVQEVIIDFKNDSSQSVYDSDRYLIIEIPDEFKIDEAAATTAGSGVYSLNDSIVYLGNQFPDGSSYTRNSIPVKYYRGSIPGAFSEKIKIDLQIKLDS